MDGFQTAFGAGFNFIGDIGVRRWVFADQNRSQSRLASRFFGKRRGLHLNFGADLSGNCFPV